MQLSLNMYTALPRWFSVIYNAHTMVYIYTRRGSFFLPSPLPLASPFSPLCTPSYLLGALQLWQNCPPSYQVTCRLTPFAPPFTQSTHSFQAPGTPIAQRLTTTTLGPLRFHYAEHLYWSWGWKPQDGWFLLLKGKLAEFFLFTTGMVKRPRLYSWCTTDSVLVLTSNSQYYLNFCVFRVFSAYR